MDGAFPFLILILVIGASVGIAIGLSAIAARWERSIPKPGLSEFLDVSQSIAPGLTPAKVFVLESASTTFTRTWSIRDVHADTNIATVEYEVNGDIILKLTSGERYFLENTEPPHRVCTLRASISGGIGAPLLVRRGGALRNADATYQHPHTHSEIVITPKLRPLFPKHLVMVHPSDHRPLASIAWLGAITAGPFFIGIAGELHDTLGDAGCCAILIFESRRFV
jgi:hypothetical protein